MFLLHFSEIKSLNAFSGKHDFHLQKKAFSQKISYRFMKTIASNLSDVVSGKNYRFKYLVISANFSAFFK